MIKIEINSVDITGYLYYQDTISWNLMRGQTGTATLPFIIRGMDAGPNFGSVGQSLIYIYEINDTTHVATCVWFGVITNLQLKWFGNDGTREMVVTGSSAEYLYSANQVDPTTYNYANMAAGDIVTALFGLAAVPGVGLGTIDAGPVIGSIAVTVISDAFNTLQTDAGFIWYVDPTDQKLYFQAPGARAAAWTLTSNPAEAPPSGMLWETLLWSQSYSDYRNTQVTTAPAAKPPAASTIASPTTPGFTYTMVLPGQAAFYLSPTIEATEQAYGYGVFTDVPQVGDTIAFGVDAGGFGVSGTFTFVASSPAGNQVVALPGNLAGTVANLVSTFNLSAFATAYNLQSVALTTMAGWAIEVWATYPGTPHGDLGNLGLTMGAPSQSCSVFEWGAVTLTPPPGQQTLTPPTGQQVVWNAAAGQLVAVPPLGVGVEMYLAGSNSGPWLGTAGDISYSLPYSVVPQITSSGSPTSGAVTQTTSLTSALTAAGLQQELDAILARYSNIPQQCQFQTDTPGLTIGRQLTIALDVDYPPFAAARINGGWYIIEVQATLMSGMDQAHEPWGHFRYTISLINALDIGTFQNFWSNLANIGGSSSSSAPGATASGAASVSSMPATTGATGVVYERTLTLTDLTTGTDVAETVIFQQGAGWRILVELHQAITADLVVQFNLYPGVGSPPVPWNFTVTVPSATPTGWPPLEFLLGDGSPLIAPQFEDQDVLTADIVASDGNTGNGAQIATFTVCWFG